MNRNADPDLTEISREITELYVPEVQAVGRACTSVSLVRGRAHVDAMLTRTAVLDTRVGFDQRLLQRPAIVLRERFPRSWLLRDSKSIRRVPPVSRY